MTLYTRFAAHLDAALDALVASGDLSAGLERRAVTVEPPRDVTHGDLATNAAMVLAKPAGTNPRALAEKIAAELEKLDEVSAVSVAGPGFINMSLTDATWRGELAAITQAGDAYGRSQGGAGVTVNIEYVSANPTGPMHMGHCRGAVVGDALASLLEAVGHKVIREYYVNDAGGQVDVLARSAHIRYREALGETVGDIPEGLYPGEYLKPVGERLAREHGDAFIGKDESAWLALFRKEAVADMLVMIRNDLALLGIHHDLFSSEAELQAAGKPEEAEAWLRANDLVYDGVLEAPKGETPEDWEPVELPLFRSTKFGDDQDRPIKKSNGAWTYFGADMAYHFQKAPIGRPADRHLGCGPCRDGQADHRRRRRADRGQDAVRRQAGPDGAPAARGRAGEDVQAVGQFRHARRCGAGSGQGRGPLHHADPQGRCADGFRLRQGGRGVEGQSGFLCPICPCAGGIAAPQGGGRWAGCVGRGRSVPA
jgi:arginyl-tRNA synthetase